jgi:hypothetical protein
VKKLLYQFDTDALPSVFDNVVGYDGGADHVSAYGGVSAKNVGGLVEGAIFTRGPQDKKHTAIFIGGGNMAEGEAVLAAVRKKFFAKFRVSVMFDCNGSNTTASAAVAWLAHGRSLAGRKREVVQAACDSIHARFGIVVEAIEAPTHVERGAAIEGAQIVLATGAAGIPLLDEKQWQSSAALELLADANATPPAGIEGVGQSDRGLPKHGKIVFGALGFGALKLALHRACVARLFEQNDLLLDAEEIYAVAKTMLVDPF